MQYKLAFNRIVNIKLFLKFTLLKMCAVDFYIQNQIIRFSLGIIYFLRKMFTIIKRLYNTYTFSIYIHYYKLLSKTLRDDDMV